MSRHVETAARNNSPLTGRNLKQNPTLAGQQQQQQQQDEDGSVEVWWGTSEAASGEQVPGEKVPDQRAQTAAAQRQEGQMSDV